MSRCLCAFALFAVILLSACKSKELTSLKVYCQNSQYDRAVEVGRDALTKEPDNAEVHFYLGLAYGELDSVRQAYQHFTTAKSLDPDLSEMADNNLQSIFISIEY